MSALAEPNPVRTAASPAVFIDRRWLESLRAEGSEPIATVAVVLRRLRDAGHRIVVASNESRVGAGELDEAAVQADDRELAAQLALSAGVAVVDRFYWCPFDPAARLANYRRDHAWRKPRPGMLLQAASDLELDLEGSWVIAGDEDDLAAARAAGCRVATLGRLARGSGTDPSSQPIAAEDFSAAAEAILSGRAAPPPKPLREEPLAAPSPTRVVELYSASTEGVRTPMATASSSSPTKSPPPNAARSRPSSATAASSDRPAGSRDPDSDAGLSGAMRDLAEELRLHRQAARDLTGGRVLAIVLQLGVLLTAVMGLLQLSDPAHFTRWFLGAILLQATAIALLLFDRR